MLQCMVCIWQMHSSTMSRRIWVHVELLGCWTVESKKGGVLWVNDASGVVSIVRFSPNSGLSLQTYGLHALAL